MMRIRSLIYAVILALAMAMPAYAQVGGATAMPPDPDQLAANQVTHPAFDLGNFAGYPYNDPCVTIATGVAPSGKNALKVTGTCAGGSFRAIDYPLMVMHNHEELFFRWSFEATSGSLVNNITMNLFDNDHGSGSVLYQQNRSQTAVAAPAGTSTSWPQGFQEFAINTAEHGSDVQLNVRIYVTTPAWAASTVEALNTKIVDSNGNVQQVTACAGTCTTGASAPTWATALNATTTDNPGANQVTWTNKGADPPTYITNIEGEEEWYPVRTFLLYPNYRGYLWNDLVPPKRFTQIQPVSAGSPFYNFLAAGSTPVAGEVMGVSTIDPPAADTLSQLTLTVKMATAAGCGSGVLATDTFASPASVQAWQFTPTQYGTLTVGSAYYVCSSLFLTSGMTLIDSYPDWKIYYENATFRNGLTNWYDPNSLWYHAGNAEILLGTYDRVSSARLAATPATLSDYEQEAGVVEDTAPSTSAYGTASPAPRNGTIVSDYCAQVFTGIMSDIVNFSGVNPTGPPNDHLTPWLNFMSTCGSNGLAHWNILNNWQSCLVTEKASPCTTAPTFAPTITGTTGSITANFLFLEGVAASAPISTGSSPSLLPATTLPSTALTFNLSTAGCAGTNCGVTFTTPTCPNTRWLGWYLYAATGSTSTPPANSAFGQQYPTVTGVLGADSFIPCGKSVTLTTVTAGVAPPTADSTFNFQPTWATATQTDETIWGLLFTAMNNSTYAKGVGGMYMADEPSYYSLPWVWEMEQQLYANNTNLPVSCVLISPGDTFLWRDVCDLVGEDPYGYNTAAAPDEAATGELTTQNCSMYQPNNAVATEPLCFRSRTDVFTDDASRATFGARPMWNVIQEFGNSGTYAGFPYLEMKTQLWKVIIDCQVYGSLGCDALTWGWVYSSGMEQVVMFNASPAAWYDSKRATTEVAALAPILETPVQDSPLLGLGAVVKGVSFSVSTATACNVNAGNAPYLYTNNTALFPDAPANFVTHTDAATGDQYIFASNLCSANAAFSATFGLANPPAGATSVEVLNEGRTLAISTTGCPASAPACFTDTTWQQEDTHIYVVRSPRGMYVH